MKISINNIGKISSAEVNLNGLTVIAGPNDSGKSTLGKALFSIIAAYRKAIVKDSNLTAISIDRLFRNLYDILGTERFTNPILVKSLPTLTTKAVDAWLALETDEERQVFLNRILEGIRSSGLSLRFKAMCEENLKSLNSFRGAGNRESEFSAELDSLITREFGGKFISMESETGSVTLSENEAVLGVSATRDGASGIQWPSRDILPTDATYIESPLYLNIARALLESDKHSSAGIQPHIVDFAEKSTLPAIVKNETETKLHGTLEGGRFEFDNKTQQLVFQRNGITLPIGNVASGLKTFGVLQLFLTNGVASPSKFIIWDEPENHLHPEWQLNFAEVLVDIAKSGFPIIVSTHSPYFIQAIRYYSALSGMESSVDYYLSEPDGNSGLNRFRRVNDTLNEVFIKMANPLNKVMNVDLARKQFNNHDS